MLLIDELLSKGYGVGNSGNYILNYLFFQELRFLLLSISVKVSCGNLSPPLLIKRNSDLNMKELLLLSFTDYSSEATKYMLYNKH